MHFSKKDSVIRLTLKIFPPSIWAGYAIAL